MSVHYLPAVEPEAARTFRGILFGLAGGLAAWAVIIATIVGVLWLAGVR